MDWTKAKTILIAALIVTNIVLGVSLFMIKSDLDVISSNEINETIDFLESRNIYVYTGIPEDIKKMPVLEVVYDNIPSEVIARMIELQPQATNRNMTKEDAINLSREFLLQNELINSNSKLESIKKEEGSYILTYKNYFKDILLEECYVITTVNNGRVEFVDRWWFEPLKSGTNKKATIPATTALLIFASLQNDLDEEIKIIDIEMVYWLEDTSLFSTEDTTFDTALPAWKITYNNGEKQYINAYEK